MKEAGWIQFPKDQMMLFGIKPPAIKFEQFK